MAKKQDGLLVKANKRVKVMEEEGVRKDEVIEGLREEISALNEKVRAITEERRKEGMEGSAKVTAMELEAAQLRRALEEEKAAHAEGVGNLLHHKEEMERAYQKEVDGLRKEKQRIEDEGKREVLGLQMALKSATENSATVSALQKALADADALSDKCKRLMKDAKQQLKEATARYEEDLARLRKNAPRLTEKDLKATNPNPIEGIKMRRESSGGSSPHTPRR